jgi:Ni,Fe-hydrogenase maturation factor
MASNHQSPEEYKEYFMNKFVSLFKDFLVFCTEKVTDETITSDLNKILELSTKLNYSKIIEKIALNNKLSESLCLLSKNNFNKEVSVILDIKEKYWSLMPSLYVNVILKNITDEYKEEFYKKYNNMYVCSVTYVKVIEQLENSNVKSETFNPFDTIGNTMENIDIETLYKGVEVKNISAYEMLMETLINQQIDNKMTDYMNNVNKDDVDDAANKLHDVLQSDKFQSNQQTAKILSDMLNNIKTEVININANKNNNMNGKQGVEQLLGIAQKVANNMMDTIKDNKVNVLDLWDATSMLAKNTTNSEALGIVDNLIRSNIEANLKKEQNNVTEAAPEHKKRNKKNKSKKD